MASIFSLLLDPRVSNSQSKNIYTIDEAKAPDIVEAIKSGDVELAQGYFYIIINEDGSEELILAEQGDTYDSAFKVSGGSDEPVTVTWDNVSGKPSTFAPSAHTHVIEDVTGLQAELDGKQPSGDYATTTALSSGLAGKANTSHTHTVAQITGLQDELDSKADESDIPDISGLVTQTELTNGLQTKQDVGDYATNTALTTGLGGKADTVHTHTQSQITGLVDDLAAKLTASQAAAVNDAVDETDIVAQFNELLANLRTAGIITA